MTRASWRRFICGTLRESESTKRVYLGVRMLALPAPFALRSLQLADLEAVVAIDRLSLPLPTKENVYRYDLGKNKLAHYQGLTILENGRGKKLIGFAGYWLLADEAHVSIIAVHPHWRGRGLGEALLLNLLLLAEAQNARITTLEVRRSNKGAQTLYHKYCFQVVGERLRYYRDEEDALLMTVEMSIFRETDFLAQKRQALLARLESED